MSASSALPQLMAILRTQRQPIEAAELLDVLERLRRKWRLALEGMQHDALQQIAQAHVLLLRDGLQPLQHSFFQPDACLHAFDFYRRGNRRCSVRHRYKCSTVTKPRSFF